MKASRTANLDRPGAVSLNAWLHGLDSTKPKSSNQGAEDLAFQRWFKFKEACSPELILDIIDGFESQPSTILDPFAGSGTTALTCQFLGIHPIAVEVNPFLADLIESKLATYSLDRLKVDYYSTIESASHINVDSEFATFLEIAPQTFCEPGVDARWIFSREVLARIFALRFAIEQVEDAANRRLLRIILGSILVHVSNVRISGKGRRYRAGWRASQTLPSQINVLFKERFLNALSDITRFDVRCAKSYTLHRSSCLNISPDLGAFDAAIFSPPYPNSFDYTDIYNVELWILGYIRSPLENSVLRNQTLTSHVQIKKDYWAPPQTSPTLRRALKKLNESKNVMWNDSIPEMVGTYFAELEILFNNLKATIPKRAKSQQLLATAFMQDMK